MYQRIVVPIDGSDYSWRALAPARAIARQCDASLEVVEAVANADDVEPTRKEIEQRLGDTDAGTGETASVVVIDDDIASTLAAHVDEVDGSLVVMSSSGRGRSAALIGSTTERLLGKLFGPVIVVGPKARLDRDSYDGEMVIAVDGSDLAETAIPLAGAWSISLHARPWLVEIVDEHDVESAGTDTFPTAYTGRLARDLSAQIGREVEFETIADRHPAAALCRFAASIDASLIVASTHGRTGLARATLGSVAMEIVHRASSPVVLNRPPHLQP